MIHGLLGGYWTVPQCDGATVLHISTKGYFKLSLVAFTNSLQWGKKPSETGKPRNWKTKTPTAVWLWEKNSCNYKALSVRLWTFIQSFTSRVACALWGTGWESTALQPYHSPPPAWELKMPSDALIFTEASLNLNRGIASSRTLNTSTSGWLWHNKSCVFIHMSLKKIQYSSCHWKVQNEKHLEPQTMF